MSHAKNKVEWCLRKAEKEVKESGTHRGLVKSKPDLKQAREYIEKAQHYIKATEYLKKGDYSDVSATTIFFSLYHSLLLLEKFERKLMILAAAGMRVVVLRERDLERVGKIII